jgi:hypothetical protein
MNWAGNVGNIIMMNTVVSSPLVLLACLSEGICNRISYLLRSNKKHAHGAVGGNEGHLPVTKQTK